MKGTVNNLLLVFFKTQYSRRKTTLWAKETNERNGGKSLANHMASKGRVRKRKNPNRRKNKI